MRKESLMCDYIGRTLCLYIRFSYFLYLSLLLYTKTHHGRTITLVYKNDLIFRVRVSLSN